MRVSSINQHRPSRPGESAASPRDPGRRAGAPSAGPRPLPHASHSLPQAFVPLLRGRCSPSLIGFPVRQASSGRLGLLNTCPTGAAFHPGGSPASGSRLGDLIYLLAVCGATWPAARGTDRQREADVISQSSPSGTECPQGDRRPSKPHGPGPPTEEGQHGRCGRCGQPLKGDRAPLSPLPQPGREGEADVFPADMEGPHLGLGCSNWKEMSQCHVAASAGQPAGSSQVPA